MLRVWIGTALLAASWLFGLSYYYPADGVAWLVTLLVGTFLLRDALARMPTRPQIGIALLLTAFPAWFFPWPYRAAPLWMLVGMAVQLVPWPRQSAARYGWGAVTAGGLLLVQSAAMWAYAATTAWSHDLPGPLAWVLSGVARLVGVESTVDGPYLVLSSLGQVHRLAATWDLFLDPGSVGFLTAGLVILALMIGSRMPRGSRLITWLQRAAVLLLVTALWLPLRAGLLVAVYLHRDLCAGSTSPLHIMNHFFSPWVHLGLLGGLAVLAWRFVRLPAAPEPAPAPVADADSAAPVAAGRGYRPFLAGAGLVLLGTAMAALGLFWEPPGLPNGGRVTIVERHATGYAPSDGHYDQATYGEAGSYNYALMYAYCGQYFEMSRILEDQPIDDDALAHCDVLIIRTPSVRYTSDEVGAVVRFVERGGGVLMIGDHTNLDRSSTHLNDIARHFGFTYRHDLLFGMTSAYDDRYVAPVVPHPMLRQVPVLDFVVSCSIDPGTSSGEAAIRGTGVWSLPPDYNIANYFPRPYHQPEMRAGAFVQLWAAYWRLGRVAAFTDSTCFVNFCFFQPGKSELLLGMLNWLNHRSLPGDPRNLLLILCVIVVSFGLFLARGRSDGWLVLLSAALCGFALAGAAAAAMPRGFTLAPPERKRPLPQVTIDRTLSEVELSNSSVAPPGYMGYSLLEQWIPRLGCYTVRRQWPDLFDGQTLVIINPTRPVSDEYRQRLVQYVEGGGRVLLLDWAGNTRSTANSLLHAFNMSMDHERAWKGHLTSPTDTTPVAALEQACQISGGQPLARVSGKPVVVARARQGKGSLLAVGFAGLFNDQNMGQDWANDPDAATLQRYRVLFALLEETFSGGDLHLEPPSALPAPTNKSIVRPPRTKG